MYITPYILATILLAAIHFLIPVRGPVHPVTVATVSTQFAAPQKGEDVNRIFTIHYLELFLHLLTLNPYQPDIITLPEDMQFTKYLVGKVGNEMNKAYPTTLFIDGDTITHDGKLSNVTIFHTPSNGTSTRAYKQFMFPLNEYIPYGFMSIFRSFINNDLLTTFARDHTYAPVFLPRTYVHDGVRIGTLLCSEAVSDTTIRTLAKEHPDIIVHQAQLGLFARSAWYEAHLRSFSKVIAAQLRTPLVGSVNGMSSYIVSPYGHIVGKISVDGTTGNVSSGVYSISKDTITQLFP